MEVLRLRHRGIECAVPAYQVVRAAEEWPEDTSMQLWRGHGDEEPDRCLIVNTKVGERALVCSSPVLAELPSGAANRVSPLLKEAMGLPHVVGWAELNEDLVWLVDLMRWSPESWA
jgi:hypothetical protein